ncbi:DUF5693 family protein [Paenibacillus profundus]|uniref:DUF5693 family protein n=1 Tax=Paenibacillus profundus TaxID=1173085 RepID=A0ABS8YKI4_9BACL|nr:DUF5693 family protein [Paenibacillus profundus]MCE5170064.1 DUF5693 family protein [Paenibacillus profundus]
MLNWYRRVNCLTLRWLWCLVILGIVSSIPLAYQRVITESSSKQVEFVFNFSNLLAISDYKANPRQFVADQLALMKQAGIQSMAVNESTLDLLKLSRRIELFSSHEAAALTQTSISPHENFTYLLFSEKESEDEMKTMIETSFQRMNVKLKPWTFKNQNGLIIEMPIADAARLPMDPDPVTLELLKDRGFHIIISLSNRRHPFSPRDMNDMLNRLVPFDVTSVIIDGDAVPGYTNDEKTDGMSLMANLLKKHQVGLAYTEMQKADPLGFDILAKDLNYDVLRLHQFSEADANKLVQNTSLQELEDRVQRFADRFVLAVKDRNIRMILLNAGASQSTGTGMYADPLVSIYSILNGKDGAVQRIQEQGYVLGPAHSFTLSNTNLHEILKLLAVLGSISIIAIAMSYFVPSSLLFIFVIGLLGACGIGMLSTSLLYKMLALGAAICAPSVAMMMAIKWIRRKQQKKEATRLWSPFLLLLCTSLLSLIGGIYIVALLDHIVYFLKIDQFIGVSAVSSVPIALVLLYLVFFSEDLTTEEKMLKAKRILITPISVLWILCAGFALVVMLYYLSRTGNSGNVSAIESLFRSLLENTIGIRPRNKEFLFAHPLFILGAYLALKNRPSALYIMAVGVIGQASLVDTFAHLHTPLPISIIRGFYGVVFGSLVSLLYIGAWNLLEYIWRKWVPAPSP